MKTIARLTEKGKHVRDQGLCRVMTVLSFLIVETSVDQGGEEEACPGETDGREVMRVEQ